MLTIAGGILIAVGLLTLLVLAGRYALYFLLFAFFAGALTFNVWFPMLNR